MELKKETSDNKTNNDTNHHINKNKNIEMRIDQQQIQGGQNHFIGHESVSFADKSNGSIDELTVPPPDRGFDEENHQSEFQESCANRTIEENELSTIDEEENQSFPVPIANPSYYRNLRLLCCLIKNEFSTISLFDENEYIYIINNNINDDNSKQSIDKFKKMLKEL